MKDFKESIKYPGARWATGKLEGDNLAYRVILGDPGLPIGGKLSNISGRQEMIEGVSLACQEW